nr:hypothetical protein CFP56_62328 [Quercus suber]
MIESFDEEKVALVVTISCSMWSNWNEVRLGAITFEVTNVTWTPPPSSPFKINVDGALSKLNSLVGIGVVIRDDMGQVVAVLCKRIHAPLGSLEVKAKAFEAGLQLVRDTGLQDIVLERDSLVIVRALCGLSYPTSSAASLILGMQLFSFEFHMVNVSHVRRQGNKPAHILAKYALSIDDSIVWIKEIPYCIEQALI